MSRSAASASPATAAPSAWADVVARYLEALRLTHYAADTVHIRALYLKYFTAWATARGLTKPEDITRAALERYQRWLYHYRKRTGTPLSVWSQHGRLVAVKGLFRWLAKQRALPTNPAAELELPRVTAQRLPQPLTDAEIIQVLAHADPATPIGLRNRALLETGYSTGLRRMELIRLRLCDLDLARGVVVVREGKGQKDRVVPIGERAIAWLEKYLDEARARVCRRARRGDGLPHAHGAALSPESSLAPGPRLPGRRRDRQARRVPPAAPHDGDGDAGAWRRRPRDPGDPGPRAADDHAALHARVDPAAQGRAHRDPSGRDAGAPGRPGGGPRRHHPRAARRITRLSLSG
jgi:site-specific recombinase XerD